MHQAVSVLFGVDNKLEEQKEVWFDFKGVEE